MSKITKAPAFAIGTTESSPLIGQTAPLQACCRVEGVYESLNRPVWGERRKSERHHPQAFGSVRASFHPRQDLRQGVHILGCTSTQRPR